MNLWGEKKFWKRFLNDWSFKLVLNMSVIDREVELLVSRAFKQVKNGNLHYNKRQQCQTTY